MRDIECHLGVPEKIKEFFTMFKRLQKLNQEVTLETTLKPLLLHPVKIFTPQHRFKMGVVLQPITKSLEGSKSKIHQQYLAVIIEKSNQRPNLAYEQKDQVFNKSNIKTSGFEKGYRYEYVLIEAKDCLAYYKNEINLPTMLHINQGVLQHGQLRRILEHWSTFSKLDEIRPSKGKVIKAILKERDELL